MKQPSCTICCTICVEDAEAALQGTGSSSSLVQRAQAMTLRLASDCAGLEPLTTSCRPFLNNYMPWHVETLMVRLAGYKFKLHFASESNAKLRKCIRRAHQPTTLVDDVMDPVCP